MFFWGERKIVHFVPLPVCSTLRPVSICTAHFRCVGVLNLAPADMQEFARYFASKSMNWLGKKGFEEIFQIYLILHVGSHWGYRCWMMLGGFGSGQSGIHHTMFLRLLEMVGVRKLKPTDNSQTFILEIIRSHENP